MPFRASVAPVGVHRFTIAFRQEPGPGLGLLARCVSDLCAASRGRMGVGTSAERGSRLSAPSAKVARPIEDENDRCDGEEQYCEGRHDRRAVRRKAIARIMSNAHIRPGGTKAPAEAVEPRTADASSTVPCLAGSTSPLTDVPGAEKLVIEPIISSKRSAPTW